MFMIMAGISMILLESPDYLLRESITDSDLRRIIIGLAMGLTTIGIIYSLLGRQPSPHFNPAVTLTFFRLGKITK
ncbi:aquaporin Z [Nitrosomonas cryotolerans]|uniref:hypothetical protein n=1 Tax=Nitrosomonas cryotolerans TaxID=44575 RepID=UPI00048E8F3C|nr:hypothetical protein [Nitrosomonas cryotolerans]SFP65812.1 aquaporin Z [Nitrosomonas cryotolerans]